MAVNLPFHDEHKSYIILYIFFSGLQVFHIYIYLAGLGFLIYVHASISYHKRRLRNYYVNKGQTTGTSDGDVHENGQLPYENSDMASPEIACICRELESGAAEVHIVTITRLYVNDTCFKMNKFGQYANSQLVSSISWYNFISKLQAKLNIIDGHYYNGKKYKILVLLQNMNTKLCFPRKYV